MFKITEKEISLSKYRLERSKQSLEAAKSSKENDDWFTTNNRLYYAIFHAIRSVLAMEKIDFKKVSKENISLMRDLQSVLSYDEYSKLINMSKQNNPLYYATLYSLFKNNKELTEKYKSLYTFLIYATKIKSMDSFELLSQRDDYLSYFLKDVIIL